MKSHPPIRILIADDHPALRAGLRALLESQPDLRVIAECGDGEKALELFLSEKPDVVLMDLRMPGMGGVEAILAIRSEAPAAKIIVNTTFDTDEDMFRAIQSGARSFLTKDLPQEDIFAVIRGVHSGRTILPPAVEQRLNARSKRPSLTGRELETLQLLGLGRSNKEIADALHLSEEAVKSRLKTLFQKLGAEDRTGAVLEALKLGILQLG
jgi:DNA-binding NarL/FixJ family response regulator